jgi:Ca2+-binding RTX toxin-like protein
MPRLRCRSGRRPGRSTIDIPYTVKDFDGDTVTNQLLLTVDGPTNQPTIPGTDLLIGSKAGADLFADAGSDTLWGHLGGDTLNGNTVANQTTTFYFQNPNDGNAVINNFDSAAGQHDVVAVSAAGFDAANAGAALSAGMNVAGVFTTTPLTTTASSERFVFNAANHELFYSPDGTSVHEVLLATVTNHTVTAGDIHVVA